MTKGVPRAFSSSVPWCVYWVVHSLDLLGQPVGDDESSLKDQLVDMLHG